MPSACAAIPMRPAVERRHRDAKAAALLVQEPVPLDVHVLQHEIRRRRGVEPELLLLAGDGDVPAVENEAGDSSRTRRFRVRAREEHERPGTRPVRDPLLRAVQLPSVLRRLRRRSQRAGIRAGSRLGEGERADLLSTRQRRDEPRPLLFRSEREDRQGRRARVHRHGHPHPGIRSRELLENQDVREEVRPRPAVLLGDAHPHEAELRKLRVELVGEAMVAVPAGCVRDDLRERELSREALDLALVCGQLEVHRA